ncbi:rCG42408 [Rattus norvegicus]|uniref:RCG42408 n=1 Tax=Rattus norvegicus TaxID=10116 RepID=A6KSE7_RAT|nr:rCG42408 [Rattus norvegicus]
MYEGVMDSSCVAGLKSLKRAQERLEVKVQPRCSRRLQHFGDARTRGQPPRTSEGVEGSQPDPGRQTVLQRAEPEK